MATDEVSTAFELLLEAIENEVNTWNELGADAFTTSCFMPPSPTSTWSRPLPLALPASSGASRNG